MNVLQRLRNAFLAATPEGGDPSAFASAVRASNDAKFGGDYQANGCMAVGKAQGKNPRAVAEAVADAVDLAPLAGKPEVAGPGFLNVRLNDAWLSDVLSDLLNDPALGIPAPERVRTVVVDFSSPNVAKPMHVGHIRSTVIGDSLSRIIAALGHKVVRDNHLGDWGLQFGMILWGWKGHRDEAAYAAQPVKELARLYRLAASKIKPFEADGEKLAKVLALRNEAKHAEADALFAKTFPDRVEAEVAAAVAEGRAVAEASRAETVKLHQGDPENRRLWAQFMPACLQALHGVYERLGVTFDVELGESFYDPMLEDVVKDLEEKGLAVQSEGATVVFIEGAKTPFLVRKSDKAFNYGTTDLATIRYRVDTWNPDQILYVVDHRQGDHFKPLFAVARKWGYDGVDLQHVAFGTILGTDRKPFKTRDGDTVGLESLLDEGVSEARKVVDVNSPDLDPDERQKVAEAVGLGAIKYADLCQNRTSDYVFDWKKMLAMNGNTGAYLQYARARVRSIFRRGGVTPEEIQAKRPQIVLDNPAERALAVRLVRLPETLELAAEELKPNILADYLFDLANTFSTFFEECPVLKAESPERRDSRLALCALTDRTLVFGLNLLGMQAIDRM
ncbi:MAG: arginine--tRNA ligase [Isosphaeraceae bacterium]